MNRVVQRSRMNTGDADSSDIPPLFGVSGVFGESASLVAWAHED